MNEKPKKRAINGVLLLDKSTGISSNTALQQARRMFNAEKAGHTGVLDPLASGLLPICFGEATKFAQYLLDADKAYIATLKLGEASTTGDAEGEIIERGRTDITLAEFQAACTAHTGQISQIPPMFSALKHEGKPLYEYARKGIMIERPARNIEIHQIAIQTFSPPQAVIEVHCSKGTYIRTLSEDLAKQMHTFAHLTALRRIATAGFTIEQSHTLEKLSMLPENQRDGLLLPCDALVQHLPRIELNAEQTQKLRFGQFAPVPETFRQPEHTPLRAYATNGGFIGLVELIEKYRNLKAVRLMNTNTPI